MDHKEKTFAERIREDEHFKESVEEYQDMEAECADKGNELARRLIEEYGLNDPDKPEEELYRNLRMAKMTTAKALASLGSLNYQKEEFFGAMERAKKCVQQEIVPILTDAKPCGVCENCRNGRRDDCLTPKIRTTHCESRFLPLLCDTLIEYDIYNEMLFRHFPEERREEEVIDHIKADRGKKHKRIKYTRLENPPVDYVLQKRLETIKITPFISQ